MVRTVDRTRNELRTIRDTVESIWIAIVLALVLRAFMIEAFVIPTGSMAPRLLGEHFQLTCPSCGYEYGFGRRGEFIGNRFAGDGPEEAQCPTCGHPWTKADFARKGGDRVLVLKYLYHFAEPKRWDVMVFKTPQDNQVNYIKRVIGLPGETVEIVHGDIFVRTSREGAPKICRKPRRAQDAMWQVVFDNDYQPDKTWLGSPQCPKWRRAKDGSIVGRRFAFSGGDTPEELFLDAQRDRFLPHYGYNSPSLEGSRTIDAQRDVCTDLKLAATFWPKASDASVILMLSSFEQRFSAEVHADGTVVLLERNGAGAENRKWEQRGKIDPLRIDRGCEIALTHADFRVTLWVGDEAVLVSTDEQYGADYDALNRRMEDLPAEGLLAPEVKIAVAGGASELRHIRLMRDVYYTSPLLSEVQGWRGPLGDFFRRYKLSLRREAEPAKGWGTAGNPITLAKHEEDPDLDEFYVLGDNSPHSLDSRAWILAAPSLRLRDKENQPLYQLGTVPRYNLVGKAFFVYWPAGFALPVLSQLAIIPNVGRMRLIR